ncbi:MAG: hypothetical protein JO321_17150 [Solirubrobacterales bacterium]|nr:hypothetical protein [Solirubrobacterales bacterium]MBV9537127.1 hypothetical protein [Solirubrobacterales bacterium]
MPQLQQALKNEYSKRLLRISGLRPPQRLARTNTGHYRMPTLEARGGWLELGLYPGPEIPPSEWESLTYTTYASDPSTYFAPITSATGKLEMKPFGDYGKCDLDGEWTPNAEKCPTIVRWIQSIGARFGRVQLLRMRPNTLRECRWGLHLDNNNEGNPETNGWAVRIWLELTHDDSSRLVLRQQEFDQRSEVQVPLPRGKQVVVDSQRLYHGGYHHGTATRYALISTVESSPALERWMDSQLLEPSPVSS